jgi:hypothetical protein
MKGKRVKIKIKGRVLTPKEAPEPHKEDLISPKKKHPLNNPRA